MATKLKVVEEFSERASERVEKTADIIPAPKLPDFEIAPTRKRHAGWTVDRQRRFIDHLALTGHVGEACAIVGVSSSSAYRLKNKPGAEGFSRAWDAALRLATTRLAAIAWDRALNGRVERFYKDGELVMERRIPSDYMATWLLSRLNPALFGSPAAMALAAGGGDPVEAARSSLPALLGQLTDVPEEECEFDAADGIDHRLGEMSDGLVDAGD